MKAPLGSLDVYKRQVREQSHRTDVERILYARGQEELVTAEELYAAFSALEPEQVTALLEQIREQAWQFLAPGERESFLRGHLPAEIVNVFGELLCEDVYKRQIQDLPILDAPPRKHTPWGSSVSTQKRVGSR